MMRKTRLILLLVFCVSGLCALSLEVLWTRMLTFVFGGTALAITTVLTAYMAGLAWGSHWGGKIADRIERPLLIYAALEVGIGIWALLIPWPLLPWLQTAQGWLATDTSALILALVRFGLCFLLLLPPTWMMGATLPLLSRFLARSPSMISRDVGYLYAANTWGAVLGCLSTGFVLLPMLGMTHSLIAIATTNLLIGLAASIYHKVGTDTSMAPAAVPDRDEEEEFPQTTLLRWTFGIAGLLSMSCQVAWSRVLALIVGSSFYAFVLVLATFLTGLAGGAWLGSVVARRLKHPLRTTAAVLIATGLAITAGIALMEQLPQLFATVVSTLRSTLIQSPWSLFAVKAAMSSLVILLPTCLMGALFPLILQTCFGTQERQGQIGRIVGQMYAWNTIGAIVGSFAAGFLLIPWLGTQLTLHLAVIVYMLLSMTLWHRSKRPTAWGYLFPAGIALVLLIWPTSWSPYQLSLGMFRISQIPKSSAVHKPLRKVHSFEEGRSATVTVETLGTQVALKVNGKTDASTGLDMPTQILAGLLPLLLHGRAENALVIGWGSGVSVGAALQFPLKTLTAVEIEPAVVRGSSAFATWNHRPQRDPRLQLRYNDGRNLLATETTKYDVLISEPSNPWISGVSALFTVEFFRLAKRRLRRGGIFCQWVQLYELSTESIRTLLGTARSVFPNAYLWSPTRAGRDSLLIARVDGAPLHWSIAAIERRLRRHPKVKKELQRVGMHGAFDIIVRLMVGPKHWSKITDGSKQNTDDNGLIEFRAPIELLTDRHTNGKRWLQRQSGFTLREALSAFGIHQTTQLTLPSHMALILALLRYGRERDAQAWLSSLQRRAPHAKETRYCTSIVRGLQPNQALAACIKRRRSSTSVLQVVRCWRHFGLPNVPGKQLLRWLKHPKDSPHRRILMGFLAYAHGRDQVALHTLAPLIKARAWLRRYPGTYAMLSALYYRQKVWPEAVWFQRLFRAFQSSYPKNSPRGRLRP